MNILKNFFIGSLVSLWCFCAGLQIIPDVEPFIAIGKKGK